MSERVVDPDLVNHDPARFQHPMEMAENILDAFGGNVLEDMEAEDQIEAARRALVRDSSRFDDIAQSQRAVQLVEAPGVDHGGERASDVRVVHDRGRKLVAQPAERRGQGAELPVVPDVEPSPGRHRTGAGRSNTSATTRYQLERRRARRDRVVLPIQGQEQVAAPDCSVDAAVLPGFLSAALEIIGTVFLVNRLSENVLSARAASPYRIIDSISQESTLRSDAT